MTIYPIALHLDFYVSEEHRTAFMVDMLPYLVDRFARLAETSALANKCRKLGS